jgi:hypothetical protein
MRCGAFHRVEGTLCLVRHGQAALSGSKTKAPGFAGGYLLIFRMSRRRYWVPTDAVERRREVGLRRRDAFSEPLGRRSSKFEKASACVSEHSGKLWSSPFHRMPCICACRTCPFRNIARTKRHVAPSRTWDMSCLPSPRCSLPPLLAFRNLYYRSGNPKHVS